MKRTHTQTTYKHNKRKKTQDAPNPLRITQKLSEHEIKLNKLIEIVRQLQKSNDALATILRNKHNDRPTYIS